MIEAIKEFFVNIFGAKLGVFVCSMLPIIELRGSIPLGTALGLEWYSNYIISVLGNLLPVPFILLLIGKIIALMKKTKAFSGVADWLEKKAEKNRGKLENGVFIGLMLFVAIPLPGTGAWTGALLAALMGVRPIKAFAAIALGVLMAGAIMTLASYGILGFLKIFI